jgi:hypothetical protein
LGFPPGKRAAQLADWEYISQVARTLCEDGPGSSDNDRAVLWYGMQAEVIAPKAPHIPRYARLHASLSILDFIEARSDLSPKSSFNKRLALPGYEQILTNLLSDIGGWRKLGASFSRATFTDDLSVRWAEAGDAAKFVEFSYRYDQANLKRKAGVTMARGFVVRAFAIVPRQRP